MLDTAYTVETPEGVTLQLHVAGPVVRCLAWSIDIAIRIALYILLAIIFLFSGDVGMGIYYLLFFIIEWFYPVFFEVYFDGATLGKKFFKLKVVHETGIPVTGSMSLLRNLLRFVDFLPFLYITGFICMVLQRDFKRLGDLAAETLVIYAPTETKETALPQVEALSSPYPLTSDEQLAIIHFAERREHLSTERVTELADSVSQLTGQTGQDAIHHLHRLAIGFIGK